MGNGVEFGVGSGVRIDLGLTNVGNNVLFGVRIGVGNSVGFGVEGDSVGDV